jgi:N-carbamoylputrescine amidase
MRIALIQQQAGPDKQQNLARGLAAMEQAAASGAGLVAFAELAFEPFWPQRPATGEVRHLAEPVPGPITEAFQAKAAELGVVVVLNLFERAGDRCITDYPCFHEQGYYAPGDTGAPVYDTRAGRVGVAICYDRHYPEYLRALALGGAELVVVPQAGAVDEWPEGLYEAEMRVAAFQNGYFVALCNRVGAEDELTFAGESFICDPGGRVVARATSQEEAILAAELDLGEVEASHARRLFLRDRRPELYRDWLENG